MEEEKKIDEKALKAFNDGYFIAKYEPELSEKISNIKASSEYVIAMQKGREQYLSEQVKDKLPSWLTGNRPAIGSLSKDKTKDLDLDR